ncbi:MAG: efflux RND transporter periplasmic adaptor subunit [Methylocystaceae bacterium]|nr:efflux RND transporter periplasmic adaptor subunit [Methylocystaceae bacterium]
MSKPHNMSPYNLVTSLLNLSRFEGSTREFWRLFVRQYAALCHAEQAMLVGCSGGKWGVVQSWVLPEKTWSFDDDLMRIAEAAQKQSIVRVSDLLAVRIDVGPQEDPPVLLMELKAGTHVPEVQTLYFAAGLPSTFQVMRQYGKARSDVVFFAEVLKLLGTIQEDKKFKQAAMRLCNEAAALFKVDQVSLGWSGPYGKQVKVCAISNLETFDQRTNAIWELEAAMEECLDKEGEIIWDHHQKNDELVRAHKAYGAVRSVGHLISVPLRIGSDCVGVLTCEDSKTPFQESDAWKLRLMLEQCVRHLSFLEHRDKWVGEKVRRQFKRTFRTLLGVDKMAYKVAALAGVAVLAFLMFGQWAYKVDGSFALKAEQMVHLSSPIDGLIEEAPVRPGDIVHKGETLLALNTRELLLEQAKAYAKLARYKHEIEKARASYSLADMRIAQSAMDSAQAEVDQIKLRLENTLVKAPYDGVVVEGDLQVKIGAPLRTGETFMKVASLNKLYAEILVNERDIQDITLGQEATITFVGRPELNYRIRLAQIIPQAEVHDGQNVFTVKAELLDPSDDWWRPGMSGVAKIDAGDRSILWLLTHETLDYLRLHFWL